MLTAPPAPIEPIVLRPGKIKPTVIKVSSRRKVQAAGKTFYHSGDLGDIIFSLPTMRALGGGTLILGPDQGRPPFHTRERMTKERAELLLPLLKLQPYIKDAKYSAFQPDVDTDLNLFRLRFDKCSPHENLAHMHLDHFGIPRTACEEQWLFVDKVTRIDGKPVVICKTLRYAGELDWEGVVATYGPKLAFIGTTEEHNAFCGQHGWVYYHPTKDLLEAARVIAGADLFISNQCGPHAIAEGLKQTLIQEPCPTCHVAMFPRANAWYSMPSQVFTVGSEKAKVFTAPRLSLTFKAISDGFSGVGQSSARLALGLHARGHRVVFSPTRESEMFGKPDAALSGIKGKDDPSTQRLIYETVGELHKWLKAGDIALTLWESTVWPASSVQALNLCRLVLVTCKWNAETLASSGCTKPIKVVPLGVDPTIFKVSERRPEICTFAAAARVAGAGGRKGIENVVQAFKSAFPFQQDVRLRIKVFSDCPVEDPKDPRIILDREYLSVSGMADWHRGNTAFISASRAEGWNLCLHEAMACGCAPIACSYGGQAEFFNKDVGYDLPFSMETTSPAGTFAGLGQWAVPSMTALTQIMRRIYVCQEEAAELGRKASAQAHRFSWENAVSELENALL